MRTFGALSASRLTLRDTWKTLQFHCDKHQGLVLPEVQSDQKSNLGVTEWRCWKTEAEGEMESYTHGFKVCLVLLCLQRHVEDSIQVWKVWSCLLDILETTAVRARACILWLCPRIMVSQKRALQPWNSRHFVLSLNISVIVCHQSICDSVLFPVLNF